MNRMGGHLMPARDDKAAWNEYQKAYARKKRLQRKALGLCSCCGKDKPAPGGKQCAACRERIKGHSRKLHADCRDKLFDAYGGRFCACCGETEIMFLTLDHIENDGASHRRELRAGGAQMNYSGLYSRLKALGFPPGLQVLCWNCNCGKHRNGGVCPHKAVR